MSMQQRMLLCCPNTTVSVTLMHCHYKVYIDAPGARTLRYTGLLERFPFCSAMPSGPPENLQHMELCFCTLQCTGCLPSVTGVDEPHAIFWASISRFSRLWFLQLELPDITDITVQPQQEDMFLKVFPDLRILKLKGSYWEDGHGAAMAIANLLQCCPSMQEFGLKSDLHVHPYASSLPRRPLKIRQLDREKSGYHDDADLAVLKTRSFRCLDHHLRKIRFEFKLESFNCFEVRLIKFLVENAAVLEEIEVHDGDQSVYDKIHQKLAEWRANSSKTKNKDCLQTQQKILVDVVMSGLEKMSIL